MRENILHLLKKGKKLHLELIADYSGILPENILSGGNNTINEDFPNKINTFLSILNINEGEDKYKTVTNVDEAIELFEDKNIQISIDNTIHNKSINGFSELRNQILSSEEMLEAARFSIESGADLLSLQIMAGKLSKRK